MSIFAAFNRASYGLWSLLKAPVSSYCRLETADDPVTLVADDGSLISALRIEGTNVPVDRSRLELLVSIITEKTGVLLEKPGHFLQLVFDYDPATAAVEIAGLLEPSRVTAEECFLSLGSVLTDWEKTLSQYCGAEKLTLVWWTTTRLLAEPDRKKAVQETVFGLPKIPGTQTEGRAVAALRHAHRGAGEVLSGALASANLSAKVMGAHDILRDIRLSLDPSWVPADWEAVLPGDKRPHLLPEFGDDARKSVLLPSLGSQLFAREGFIIDRDLIRIGQRLHAPFIMTVPPMSPKPFAELMRVLSNNQPPDPLRMSINLSPDGFDGLGLKAALAGILGFSSAENRKISAAVKSLKSLAESGSTVVGLSMAFDTHLDLLGDETPSEAVFKLKSRRGRLARQISGWGQAQLGEVVGDPLLGVAASLPALMPHGGVAPRAAAPLRDALGFIPVRPASPFGRGSLIFRTSDGKIMPFAPMSSVQSAWIDLALAPMGGGKSVLLNTLNLAFCLQPGLTTLPLVSIIDVGPSSDGLIGLLKAALPRGLKHQAASHRLTMDPAQAVNPFDTPLGCREPLSTQLAFLVNLLCLLCTPLDAQAPPTGTEGIVRQAIISSYRELIDRPRLISRTLEPELFELAVNSGFGSDDQSSWWELTDFFFEQGLYHESHLAQRRAVPILSDISAQVRQHPGLKASYGFTVSGTSENILDFVWRQLTEAVAGYRCLAGPTKFSLGEARVVSLDLDEVATRGGGAAGDRRTAVMYMLARHLAGSKFFLTPSLLGEISPPYRAYHAAEVARIRREPKRLCYDELHRVTGLTALRDQLVGDLETSARE
ncbi:MAG: hypothetical protein LBT47_09295 [Deltaproteobacteria bacterium]|nr:hypothetical protein [Deltaproteobacteria bacterium]